MDKDFEERLKKQLESKIPEDEPEEDDDKLVNLDDPMRAVLGMIETGALIDISKASKTKMEKIFDKLLKRLQEYKKGGKDGENACKITAAIKTAANELRVLEAFITAAGLSAMQKISDPDSDLEDILDLIVKMCTNR